ncbi:MAG: methyltransferase [Aeromicrobium sp.]
MTTPGAAERLEQAVRGYQNTAILHAAIQLDLPDVMAAGEPFIDDLSAGVRCDPAELVRLLRALELLDVCTEVAPGQYVLTEAGRCLLRNSPEPHRELIGLAVDQYWDSWADLAHSVRTRESAFVHLHGVGPFAWRQANPASDRLFGTWLSKETARSTAAITAHIDLSTDGHVVDVGGGHGGLLAALLQRHPGVQGTLFDQPAVLDQAAAGWPPELTARTAFVAGDFFESVPVLADVFVLKSILHDWTDDQSVQILSRCAASMAPGARLLVVERLLNDPDGDHAATVRLDLHMMAVTGGRERSASEYEHLLGSAGLTVDTMVSTRTGFAIVEARCR